MRGSVQVKYNFRAGGDWEAEPNYELYEGEPIKGELISYEGFVYEVTDIKKKGDIYELYLN
ncbi:hypothetical protein U6X16_04525 [Bacillus velezensis]|uniref:hypothetical protein n=1 Tax=Bacillus velezensis TaxID=492670 RepID=UPI002ADE6662|nr:hypothetical protein [Bacillus velezensis]MEA1004964.1 hypothetical protein [Bacillus velezensis]